ncbi:SUKH-3 domain-containing protein [Actinomadura rifamycini]|uniref:SUKH-3 domain-containing protein n=1 Tax=Actinomadura rifamycini TaxID=31962 RepID=UPI00146C81CE|nr:SUKH-3 domain-containing protein [Actinomadura rifamycini]
MSSPVSPSSAQDLDRALRRAGWRPGRKVDISAYRAWYAAEGYGPHAAGEAFLEEFGGLRFDWSGPGVSVARQPFFVDPARTGGEDELIEAWAEDLGKNIVPLGGLEREMSTFGMDEDGLIYLFAGFTKVKGANRDGLEALVLGIDGETLED